MTLGVYTLASISIGLALSAWVAAPALVVLIEWLLVLLGALVGTAVVVLGFRRYAWIELGIVYGVFLLLSDRESRKQYVKGLFAVAVATGIAIALTWSQLHWSERLASVNPWTTKQENSYSRTNQGHMDDILDGLDQVRAHPLFGLGVGVTYVGTRTARWKGEAGMVHNGPIEIWIKFGVIGVLMYISLYLWLFASAWKRRRGTRYSDLLAWGGGAFLLGNFLVNFTVYSWPFNVWEKSVLIFAVFAVAWPHRREQSADHREVMPL
jgi:O-antigen ligase